MKIIKCDIKGCNFSEDFDVVNLRIQTTGGFSTDDWIYNTISGDMCPVHYKDFLDKLNKSRLKIIDDMGTESKVLRLKINNEEKDKEKIH
jgi:hypothetical protein